MTEAVRVGRLLPLLLGAMLAIAPAAGAEAPPPAPTPPTATATATPEPVSLDVAPTPPAVTPAPEATPAPTVEATPTPASPPAPAAAMAAPAPQATPAPEPAARPATRARQPAATAAPAQEPPPEEPAPAPPAPSDCASPDGAGACDAPSAACTLLGTDGDDVLTGTPLDDVMCGFGGDDRLEGGAGDDTLFGGEGDDDLVGGEGTDCMVGGGGSDSADTGQNEAAEVEDSADGEPSDVILDAGGHCIGAVKPDDRLPPEGCCQSSLSVPKPSSSGGAVARAGSVAAPGADGEASVPATVDLRLAAGPLTVRRGVLRLRLSCSASAAAELVVLAGSERIAHKRFTCRPPGRTLRVRLNDRGRAELDREGRVRAQVLVLSGGQTSSEPLVLVTPRG